jgi:hypothetical protein
MNPYRTRELGATIQLEAANERIMELEGRLASVIETCERDQRRARRSMVVACVLLASSAVACGSVASSLYLENDRIRREVTRLQTELWELENPPRPPPRRVEEAAAGGLSGAGGRP